ncbi:MAG: sugar transferase [Clostridiales bacterium]|nr:sugar transferase [Candidatus Cacconaster stercorequi]
MAIEEKIPTSSINDGCTQSAGKAYLFSKRAFDILLSLIGLIVAAIPMAVIAIWIKCDSSGPVLLRQERVGKGGEVFRILKFRTMYTYAPNNVATSLLENADRYITPVGRVLRKTSLDELPQLWNVLRGDMSLVGYRPVCLTEKKLNALRREYGVFVCKPGITGLAQVRGRDDLPYKEKAKVDAEYVAKRSLRLDLYCLLMTIPVALTQRGAK